LLARVENAPLPASYRALAQSPLLRGNVKVAALVDTLNAIERERQDFGAAGGVDPIFMALTARAGEVGRAITDVAYRKRNQLREEITSLRQMQPQRDTLSPSIIARFKESRRDSISAELDDAEEKLAALRLVHLRIDSATTRARELASVSAPPIAMLASSAVLAVFAGFGGTLTREILRPRIANSHEAEQFTGIRVIAVVTPARREQATRDLGKPSLIDLSSESYRRLYLYLAGSQATLAMVTVTGDDPEIHAVVAANIAAAAGGEGRGTLLVDGDLVRSPLAAIFGVPHMPGLSEIIGRKTGWPEALEPIVVARDLSLDLVPSGQKTSEQLSREDAERIRRDLGRMARRYDVMVLNAPLMHVRQGADSILPAPDVLLCVRVGHTGLGELRESLVSLRAAGTRISGLVLWTGDDPRIPSLVPAADHKMHRGLPVPSTSMTS
jgi:tyrosine-protein kinase Etk/Wzc